MTNSNLKLLQVRQILGNPFFTDDNKLRMLNAVVKNDFGKLTAAEAKRLVQIRRGFATVLDLKDKTSKFDRSLIRRGLVFYRVDRKPRYSEMYHKSYTNKTLVISAIAERALAAHDAAKSAR